MDIIEQDVNIKVCIICEHEIPPDSARNYICSDACQREQKRRTSKKYDKEDNLVSKERTTPDRKLNQKEFLQWMDLTKDWKESGHSNRYKKQYNGHEDKECWQILDVYNNYKVVYEGGFMQVCFKWEELSKQEDK